MTKTLKLFELLGKSFQIRGFVNVWPETESPKGGTCPTKTMFSCLQLCGLPDSGIELAGSCFFKNPLRD